jgi:hypothetical protein
MDRELGSVVDPAEIRDFGLSESVLGMQFK